jgi:hypothetical protein
MLPIVTIELEHKSDAVYKSRIVSHFNQDISRCEFTLAPEDSFLVRGKTYLETDVRRKDTDIDTGFIKRMGKHFYDLITGGQNDFKNYLRLNKELKAGFCLHLALDCTTIKEKYEIPEKKESGDTLLIKLLEILIKRLKEKTDGIDQLSPGADLLWQVPWEYLHDGEDCPKQTTCFAGGL